MTMDMCLPPKLQTLVAGQPYTVDSVGMSGSKVLLFADKVLKIQPETIQTQNERRMMIWLDGKFPVPKCLYHTAEAGISYFLMSRIGGKMACDEVNMRDPEKLTRVLAESLKRLWAVDISDCPEKWDLRRKLPVARAAVEDGKVDLENVEPGTFGENGFRNPQELLYWLWENQPEEDLVLSHGDFCLPNVFLDEQGLTGLIDLGRMGVADRWQDIALCYRSLKHNYGGRYGGNAYDGYDPDSLFEALGIKPDWQKLQYYLLLDELF